MPADTPALTDNAILNGRLRLLQPKRGHRFGHDAILLAAAVPAAANEHAIEFGSGVGAAGLALLARIGGARLTLIEIDPALAELAVQNIARNGFANAARVIAMDAGAPPQQFSARGLAAGIADHVFMNPPFNDATRPSPDRMRKQAHVASPGLLADWIGGATHLLRDGGTLTGIWRADALPDVLAALSEGFGSISVLPVHGKEREPPIRAIVRAVKGGGAALACLPPLVLNDSDNHPTPEAEAIMRDLVPLAQAQA